MQKPILIWICQKLLTDFWKLKGQIGIAKLWNKKIELTILNLCNYCKFACAKSNSKHENAKSAVWLFAKHGKVFGSYLKQQNNLVENTLQTFWKRSADLNHSLTKFWPVPLVAAARWPHIHLKMQMCKWVSKVISSVEREKRIWVMLSSEIVVSNKPSESYIGFEN